MRTCLPALLIALLVTIATSPPARASRPVGQWLPTVRVVCWSGLHRLDRLVASYEGDRRLIPLDRGVALHLGWAIGAASSRAPLQRDGTMPSDLELDDWVLEAGLNPAAEAGRHVADLGEHRSDEAPQRPAASIDDQRADLIDARVVRRRAAAVRRAVRALRTARTPVERQRALIDVHEAQARLRLLEAGGPVDRVEVAR